VATAGNERKRSFIDRKKKRSSAANASRNGRRTGRKGGLKK
jgi:hypothetical protein